jgi:CheY-like chemotaxis protein
MNVLILEDEPLIAMSMQALVEDNGWAVVGPFSNVVDAVAALGAGTSVDCALLDCNLDGEPSWAVADALAQRNVPFAFTSGQSASDIDPRFAGRPTFAKPVDEQKLKHFLASNAATPAGG